MAIIGAWITPDVSSSIDLSYTRQSERTYKVWAGINDDENYVRNNFGVAIGSAHPTDPQQRCVGLSVRCVGRTTSPADSVSSCLLWEARAQFGPWNPLENPPDGNPLNVPKRFRFEVTTVAQPAVVDVDGNPIVNSAGDYYDPPVEREVPRVKLVVMRNEASPSPATLLALANVVNLNAWNGFPPKTVKLVCPKLPEVQYSQAAGAFYWPMEYEFDINFDTWVVQVLNRGYRQLDDDGNLVPILVNGQPVSDPCFLDLSGKAVLKPDYLATSGDTPGDPSPGGFSGEPDGGGEPPMGGGAEADGVVVNAYDICRVYDFSHFNMDNLFTLPSPFL